MKILILTAMVFTSLNLFGPAQASADSNQTEASNICFGRICVGDEVIPADYSSGAAVVVAINQVGPVFTVLRHGNTVYDRYAQDFVGVLKGCAVHVCVGDEVIPNNYSSGTAKVVSVSTAGVLTVLRVGDNTYDRYSEKDVAIMNACSDFDSERR